MSDLMVHLSLYVAPVGSLFMVVGTGLFVGTPIAAAYVWVRRR